MHVEHLFWELKAFCFRHDLRAYNLSANYKSLVNVFLTTSTHSKKYTKEEIDAAYGIIIEFSIIRMAHVHGGFPNAIPQELNKQINEIIPGNEEKQKYSKEQIIYNIEYYSSPKIFENINNKFKSIYDFLSKYKISIGI